MRILSAPLDSLHHICQSYKCAKKIELELFKKNYKYAYNK